MNYTKQYPRISENLCRDMGLTEVQLNELCNAADATWRRIGCDILESNDGADIPRDQVIDVIMDADHIVSNNEVLSATVQAVLRNPDKHHLVEKALRDLVFVYRYYGV